MGTSEPCGGRLDYAADGLTFMAGVLLLCADVAKLAAGSSTLWENGLKAVADGSNVRRVGVRYDWRK